MAVSSPAAAYFPRADDHFETDFDEDGTPTPIRPDSVGPVFDKEHAHLPLPAYDEEWISQNYTRPRTTSETIPAPAQPDTFQDQYLVPSLTRHERLRLTMLWYYTKDMTKDLDLLRRLQDRVNLVQEFIGWEFAIMGIMDNDVYTRVATAGLPLAILPRRESTCAHTVNQETGVTFDIDHVWMIADFKKDRFCAT